MKKLGVMVNNLAASQLAFYLINYANLVTSESKCDVILFYDNPTVPCVNLNCASMQVEEAWGFDAPVVATNLSLANKLLKIGGPTKKYFYLWDLEWMRLKEKHFESLQHIYRNPLLKLLARSKSHAQVIESCWNRQIDGIVDNCDINTILEITDANKNK